MYYLASALCIYLENRYKWTLNGVEIGKLGGREASCNDILSVTSDGTLKVSKDFVALCNGEYQCVAENSNGKSMTPYLTLNRTGEHI